MKKKDIFNSFDSINPNDDQRERILNGILRGKKDLNIIKAKRPKFIVVAALICLMTTTVIASNISSFLNLKDKIISPDMIELIEPIEEVSIDKGIKMEVVAVGRYDNMVKAYINFQDLEDNRIGEDISFLDYLYLKGSDSFGWTLVDYDEMDKRVTILVEAQSNIHPHGAEDPKFEGENLTFGVTNIFYDHKEYLDKAIDIDLTSIDRNPSYTNVTREQLLSGSTNIFDSHNIQVLKTHLVDFKLPEIESFMISNIGIIDGNLHIQTWRDKDMEGHSSSIYLRGPDGNRIDAEGHVNFGDVDKDGNPIPGNYPTYQNYLYHIDVDRLDEYKLFTDFTTSQQLKGNWEITFKAQDKGVLKIDRELSIDGLKIHNISITPFGISLRGKGILHQDLDIEVNMKDYVVQTSPSSRSQNHEDFTLLYNIENPIDLALVESIRINGQNILIKKP